MKTLRLLIVALLVCQVQAFSQDYYSGKAKIEVGDQVYNVQSIGTAPGRCFIQLRNTTNSVIGQPRYRLGSDPVQYYSYATGMGHLAEIDAEQFDALVKKVFTQEEIAHYTETPGCIMLSYAVDPENGKVLEVEISLTFTEDKTITSIPAEKISLLEKYLKEEMVCGISDELKKERQSYAVANNSLFVAPSAKKQ